MKLAPFASGHHLTQHRYDNDTDNHNGHQRGDSREHSGLSPFKETQTMRIHRQDSIWSRLTKGERNMIRGLFARTDEDDEWQNGYASALQAVFGEHNLTGREEPKEEKPDKVEEVQRLFRNQAFIFGMIDGGKVRFNGNIPNDMNEASYLLRVVNELKKLITDKHPTLR